MKPLVMCEPIRRRRWLGTADRKLGVVQTAVGKQKLYSKIEKNVKLCQTNWYTIALYMTCRSRINFHYGGI